MENNLKKVNRFSVIITKIGDHSNDIQYWIILVGIKRLR